MSTTPPPPALPPSPSAPPPPTIETSRGSSFKGRYGQKESSGCEVPFVPAGEGSSFTRFKQLSTRRSNPTRPKFSPSRKQQRTVSSPSLHSLLSSAQDIQDAKRHTTPKPTSASPQSQPPQRDTFQEEPEEGCVNNNAFMNTAMLKSDEHAYAKATPFVDLTQWTDVEDQFPGKRKASGFFQPIRHLSGIHFSSYTVIQYVLKNVAVLKFSN